jgi:hypothetical protein
MESKMNMSNNPLLVKVEVKEEVLDTSLEKAQSIYNGLQEDIQRHLIEEYITPELNGLGLIKEFDKIIESEECQRLDYKVLLDVVGKIINHSGALAQMCEINTLGFKSVYHQHFIQGINTFKHPSFYGHPLDSMCLEFVMRKWH